MKENVNAAEKKRLPLSHSGAMKTIVFVLAVALLFALAASVLGIAACLEFGVYYTPKEDVLKDLNWGQAYFDTWDIGTYVGQGAYQAAVDNVMQGRNVMAADIACSGEQNWIWKHGDMSYAGQIYDFEWRYYLGEDGSAVLSHSGPGENIMHIRLLIADNPEYLDEYYLSHLVTELCFGLRYIIYPAAIIILALCVLCVVFLLKSAGRRRGKPGITPSWATAIPFDLLTAIAFVVGVMLIVFMVELSYEEDVLMVFCVPAAAVMAALLLGWLMSFALRVKLGTLWRNTVIFRVLKLIWRAAKTLWRKIKKLLGYFMNLRFFWQAGLVFGGIAILELFFILITAHTPGAEVFFWFLETVVLLAGLVYVCLMLREVRRCGKAVAEGDMSFESDTRLMPRAFREHIEDLKGISLTVNKAVEERMSSERMKTELITNVSHDLKTPLTSLINYSDLICRGDCNNPDHREYADVLHRQSEKMKRLVDDLVEASKASSGSIDISLAPCAVDVLLAQAAAEYEQRLAEAGLTPVLTAKEPLKIMADGRRLWRVVDNLMNNICKYALGGTRVYLAAEKIGGEVVISFKNTSREQLNLSGEELAERFVRGDASRGGEGSGLGLSIARSLTELQGGKMEISCDGDLFKAQLKFPYIK